MILSHETSDSLRSARGALVAVLLSLVGCTAAAKGGPGESCTKRADCANGLRCVAQRCVGEDAAPEPADEAVGPAVVEAAPAMDLEPADGPFRSIAEFCKTIDDFKDVADPPCRPRKDEGAASANIEGLGSIQVIETAYDAQHNHLTLAITTEAGIFVAKNRIYEGGGSDSFDTIKSTKLTPDGHAGAVTAEFTVEEMRRIDDGSGKPGAAMPTTVKKRTTRIACGLTKEAVPGCTKSAS